LLEVSPTSYNAHSDAVVFSDDAKETTGEVVMLSYASVKLSGDCAIKVDFERWFDEEG
jgi:hypothetical protein